MVSRRLEPDLAHLAVVDLNRVKASHQRHGSVDVAIEAMLACDRLGRGSTCRGGGIDTKVTQGDSAAPTVAHELLYLMVDI